MTHKLPELEKHQRVAREVERERRERALNDEQRTGLAVDEEFRRKDARANPESAGLKRSSGR